MACAAMVPTFIMGELMVPADFAEPSLEGLVDGVFEPSEVPLVADCADNAGDASGLFACSACCSASLDVLLSASCEAAGALAAGVGGNDASACFCGVTEMSFACSSGVDGAELDA